MSDYAFLEEFRKSLLPLYNEISAADPNFPLDCCYKSARLLYIERGFYVVNGVYHGPFSEKYLSKAKSPKRKPFLVKHFFSYDSDTKLFIDFTARQFHDSHPEILLIPVDDPRVALDECEVVPGISFQARYIRGVRIDRAVDISTLFV